MAGGKPSKSARTALIVAVALTLLAVAIGVDAISYALASLVAVALVYAMWKAPLRHSLLVLMFCAFTLENPEEGFADRHWQSPFSGVGAALLTHLNNTTGARWMSFSGMDLALFVLLVVAAVRKTSGSRVDSAGRIATPRPLAPLAYLSLAGTACVWLVGMARGGNPSISLWQINKVVYLPIVFFLFSSGIRGPKDHAALARVLLLAATIRAAVAVYVAKTVVVPGDPTAELAYATTHHDSILFATAVILLIALMLERVGRRATK